MALALVSIVFCLYFTWMMNNLLAFKFNFLQVSRLCKNRCHRWKLPVEIYSGGEPVPKSLSTGRNCCNGRKRIYLFCI